MRRYRDTGKPVPEIYRAGFARWNPGWGIYYWYGDTLHDPLLNRMVLCIEMELVDDGFPESERSRRSDQTARI